LKGWIPDLMLIFSAGIETVFIVGDNGCGIKFEHRTIDQADQTARQDSERS